MVFECICNMVLNIKGMKWLTCEGVISLVKHKRNSVLRCSTKRLIKKGEASKFPYTDCSKYYGQRRQDKKTRRQEDSRSLW